MEADINLLILNESSYGEPPLDKRLTRRLILEALSAGGLKPNRYEVSLYFVDDNEMRRLNSEHRGLKRTTDVLSFPQFESVDEIIPTPDGDIVLGDVVVSLETLRRRCKSRGEDPRTEFIRFLTHGVLHLVGFDHKSRAGRSIMREIEQRVVDTVSGESV